MTARAAKRPTVGSAYIAKTSQNLAVAELESSVVTDEFFGAPQAIQLSRRGDRHWK